MLAQYLSYEFIALFMFITMLVMMFTGQRVFGAIGFVAAASALLIWGEGSMEMPYTATWKLFKCDNACVPLFEKSRYCT